MLTEHWEKAVLVFGKAWKGVNISCLIDFCSECSYVNVLLEILKNRQQLRWVDAGERIHKCSEEDWPRHNSTILSHPSGA